MLGRVVVCGTPLPCDPVSGKSAVVIYHHIWRKRLPRLKGFDTRVPWDVLLAVQAYEEVRVVWRREAIRYKRSGRVGS